MERADGSWPGRILLLASLGFQAPPYQHKVFNHRPLSSVVLRHARGCGWGLFHWCVSKGAAWNLNYCQHFWVSYEPPALQVFLQEEFFSPLRSSSPQQTSFQHLPQTEDSAACSANALFWALLFKNQYDACKAALFPTLLPPASSEDLKMKNKVISYFKPKLERVLIQWDKLQLRNFYQASWVRWLKERKKPLKNIQ